MANKATNSIPTKEKFIMAVTKSHSNKGSFASSSSSSSSSFPFGHAEINELPPFTNNLIEQLTHSLTEDKVVAGKNSLISNNFSGSNNQDILVASDKIIDNLIIIPSLPQQTTSASTSTSTTLIPNFPETFNLTTTYNTYSNNNNNNNNEYGNTNFSMNLTAESSSKIPQIPAYIRTTAMFFCIVIMVMGVIGNVMVPIVIIRTKDMRNSTNIFLTNLSIADLLVLLVCTPTVLVELNTRPETWVLGHEMCKAVPFIELTVAHASVLTILAISFERYYAICEPLKAGYVCTKTRAILICSLAWGIAALFTSPILLMAEYKYLDYIDGSLVPVCLTQALTVWTKGFFVMTVGLFFLLPLMILIILYGIIAQSLISKNGPMMRIRPTKPEFSLKARKQVVLMLGAVVLAFFLCLLPFRVFTLWFIFDINRTILEIGIVKYYSLLYFCRIMWYLNSAINPILYNLMSTKFRKGFHKLMHSLWRGMVKCLGAGKRSRGGLHAIANANTTTTSHSNTNTTSNTTTTTSSSIMSRSSQNRRSTSSDEFCHRTRVQIQMQMPYGSDCEMVAMLHNGNVVDCRSIAVAKLPALQRYGSGGVGVGRGRLQHAEFGNVIKPHPQRRLSSSSLQQQHRYVVGNRLQQTKHISFEEEEAALA